MVSASIVLRVRPESGSPASATMFVHVVGGASFFVVFFQAEDGIRDLTVTGVQTCALPISLVRRLERLEQKYRRLQGTNRLLVVGVAVLLGTAAATVVTLALRLPRLSGDVVQDRKSVV